MEGFKAIDTNFDGTVTTIDEDAGRIVGWDIATDGNGIRMKGYKAFDTNWRCRDFQYEIGKTYELPEGQTLQIGKCGFHFCKNPIDVFANYPLTGTLIAEVEALGNIQHEGIRFCTDKIKIVREFTLDELQLLFLKSSFNSSSFNTGNFNSGSYNSGSNNSGSYNSGNYNTGSSNSGSCNSGFSNTGYYNTGNYNSGNFNSGNYNSGRYNAGDYNTGDYNTGIFNTDEPCMRAFNRDTNITFSEFMRSIGYNFSALLNRISRHEIDDKDIEHVKALPNYDADLFYEITGIDLREA